MTVKIIKVILCVTDTQIATSFDQTEKKRDIRFSGFLKPHFRNGQFYEGLDEATTAIFLLAAGEYTADELNSALENQKEPLIGFVVGIAIIILIIIVSMSFRNRGPKAIGRPLSPWEMLILGSGMNRPSSGWTDFSHGSGSFGGGGGFGGFGGGMTGGGGSAGSW